MGGLTGLGLGDSGRYRAFQTHFGSITVNVCMATNIETNQSQTVLRSDTAHKVGHSLSRYTSRVKVPVMV